MLLSVWFRFGIMLPKTSHWYHAAKVGCAISIPSLIGFAIYPHLSPSSPFQTDFHDAILWAGITIALILLPSFPKVITTGIQRFVGTVTGGFLAYGFYVACQNWIFLTISTILVATLAIAFADAAALPAMGRFFLLTWWVISWTMYYEETNTVTLAITRVVGITCGIIITILSSMLIFPSISSLDIATHIEMCLNAMNNLNRLAFNPSIVRKDDNKEEEEGETDDTVLEKEKRQPPTPPLHHHPLPGRHQSYLPSRLTLDTYPQLFEAQRIVNSFFGKIREDIIDMRQEYYAGKTWWGQYVFLPRLYLLPTGSNVRGGNNNSSPQEVKRRGGGGGNTYVGEDVARHVLQAMMVICRILWSLELLLLPTSSSSSSTTRDGGGGGVVQDTTYNNSRGGSSESSEWEAFCVKHSDVLGRLSRLLPAVSRLYSERKRLSAVHPSFFCVPIPYSHKKSSAESGTPTNNSSTDVEEALSSNNGLSCDGDIKMEFESLLQIWESWKKDPPMEDHLCTTRFTALSVLISCYIEHLKELHAALNAFYDAQQHVD